MVKIKRIQLSEITELITKGTTPTTLGYEFQDVGVNFLKIECFDENGNFINDKVAHISEACHEKLKRSQLKAGDVLFSIAGAIGRVAIVTEDMLPANTNQALAIIRIVDNQVHLPYIKLILTSPIVIAQFEKRKQGVAQLNLSLKDINEIMIPLPSIDKQIELAEMFAKISDIVSKRREELSILDDLIRARFVELTEGTETVPTRMGNIATYLNGYAFKPVQWEESGLPIIRIQNLNDTTAKYNYYSGTLPDKYFVQNGDVLVSWATHLEAYIWKGQDAWLNQHIFKVVFDKIEVDKIYFVYACEEALRQAFRNAHGFKPTMEHIKKADFDATIVKLPSIDVQRQFADFVKATDKSKFQESTRLPLTFLNKNQIFLILFSNQFAYEFPKSSPCITFSNVCADFFSAWYSSSLS